MELEIRQDAFSYSELLFFSLKNPEIKNTLMNHVLFLFFERLVFKEGQK